MKIILFTFFLLFVVAAKAEYCNWGFAGPTVYRCDGETYYYGTAACSSGFYNSVFCHKSLNQDGQACATDNSKDTVACYKRMVAPDETESESKPKPKPRTESEPKVETKRRDTCNWGFAGPQVVLCNEKRYLYGTAACASGFYSGLFCEEKFSEDGKKCSEDNSSFTMQCYNKFMEVRPAKKRGGSTTEPVGGHR